MNNLPFDKLNAVAGNIGEVVKVINEGVQWIDKYMSNEGEMNYELKSCRRKLNKVRSAVLAKPTIALFGASQVGKSYMANNLLYDKNNKLMIFNHRTGDTIDFIKHLNPEGHGNESTSAVTRFTSEVEQNKDRLPVQIKLFSPKDIVAILCDSYYHDYVGLNKFPSKEDILELIGSISSFKQDATQIYLSEDDVYEIKEYFEKYFEQHQAFVKLFEDTGYWDALAASISHIDVKDWIKMFTVLWNRHPEIDQLFTISIEELQKMQFSASVWGDFDTINRESGKPIINVITLSGFFNADHTFKVQLNDGKTLAVSSGRLCFLTAEIVLCVSESSVENRPFIKNSDIIDFPGARMRPELQTFSEVNLTQMLLRGKVSYLFNHYSSNFKTNILCACMRTQQTNVTVMPRLINNWVKDNLGADEKERSANLKGAIPPLFIIFTWWNTQLEYKAATDSSNPLERIEKLFNLYRNEILGDSKWHDSWNIVNNRPARFSNFYLLRDFKKSDSIYRSQANGREEEAQPFTNKDQEEFYRTYFEKFMEYHQAQNRFFEDPEMNFNEASLPNKDGSELIIKNLAPIASNVNTMPIYINIVNETMRKASELLNSKYYSDKADEQIYKAARNASEIHMIMNKILGTDSYHFGNFIEHLIVSEREIFQLNHSLLRSIILIDRSKINEIIFFREYSPRLILGQPQSEKVYKENIEILRQDYHRESLIETEEFFRAKGIDLNQLFFGEYNLPNKSDSLAETAKEYWFNTKLSVDNFQYFIDMGFDQGLLSKLLDNLKANFLKLNLTKTIALEIKAYVDVDKKLDVAEDMIAHIIAGKINEFVNSVGWTYYTQTEKQRIAETNRVNNLNLALPDDHEVFWSLNKAEEPGDDKMSVEKLIDMMDNLNENLSRVPIDPATIDNIPMIKSYRRWRELVKISFVGHCDIPMYNVEANKMLGDTLEKFKHFHFSVV